LILILLTLAYFAIVATKAEHFDPQDRLGRRDFRLAGLINQAPTVSGGFGPTGTSAPTFILESPAYSLPQVIS